MAFAIMLASSAPWYLPALFMACLSWTASFSLLNVLRERPLLHRLYVWLPPVMVLGLLVSRAGDLAALDPTHPEVALILGDGADVGARLQVLFTGQGAVEGALLSLLVFAVLSPRLPSLRGASTATTDAVQSRMMTHAGWWGLLTLMMLFEPTAYEPMTAPPAAPTVSVSPWSALATTVLFTLLLMMAGEIMSATARMASSGETHVLFHRALLKTALAGTVAWGLLVQTDALSPEWWARPTMDARLATGILVVTYTTLMATSHAFSTVAEGLHSAASRQATLLTWALVAMAVVLFVIASTTAHAVEVYGQGLDAALTGWRWAALALTAGAIAMTLPMVGFDAAHHPEAWWFRMAFMLFLPAAALMADGGWLLLPAMLLAGGVFPVVHLFVMAGASNRTPGVMTAAVLTVGTLIVATSTPQRSLFLAAGILVLATGMAAAWYRRERQRSLGESSV